MVDRTTKVFLFAIALGLWLHLVDDWRRPTPAHAQTLNADHTQALRDIAAIRTHTATMHTSLQTLVQLHLQRR